MHQMRSVSNCACRTTDYREKIHNSKAEKAQKTIKNALIKENIYYNQRSINAFL
jgi:hypothetical protein